MNKKLRIILLVIVALASVLLIASCGDESHYDEYDEGGYQISVKYDANGGILTEATSVIVDTYALNSLPTKDGVKVAKLINPADKETRGDVNKFKPTRNGYSFVGWYAERTEKIEANGEVSYTYSKMWDFEKDRLELDPNGDYSASEPVLTLYAAWIPKFSFEFYSIDDPETLLKSYEVAANSEIAMPYWDKKTGEIYMGVFPEIENKTFLSVYSDPEGKNKLTGENVKHSGTLNLENATAVNPTMKLYIDTMDGEWKHIYTASQLGKIDLNGNYIIMNDLDFHYKDVLGRDKFYSWADYLIGGKFTGKLIGAETEGGAPIKIKNLRYAQLSGASVYSVGMFGQISAEAEMKNLAFEDMILTMDKGATATANVSFGMLAGKIEKGADIKNVSVGGTIEIYSNCRFKDVKQVFVGLASGSNNNQGIDFSGVSVSIVGDNPERITYIINGNRVELTVNE